LRREEARCNWELRQLITKQKQICWWN